MKIHVISHTNLWLSFFYIHSSNVLFYCFVSYNIIIILLLSNLCKLCSTRAAIYYSIFTIQHVSIRATKRNNSVSTFLILSHSGSPKYAHFLLPNITLRLKRTLQFTLRNRFGFSFLIAYICQFWLLLNGLACD